MDLTFKVLVVDDEEDIRIVFNELLSEFIEEELFGS